MRINYKALIFTFLALIGLAIYRILTPEHFLMVMSHPEDAGKVYLASSEAGRSWKSLNPHNPIVLPFKAINQNDILWQKKSDFKFRALKFDFYKNRLLLSQSVDMLEWFDPVLVVLDRLPKVSQPVLRERMVRTARNRWTIFMLVKGIDGSSIFVSETGNDFAFNQWEKTFVSVDSLLDFNVLKTGSTYLMVQLSKGNLKSEQKLALYTSKHTNGPWTLTGDNIRETFVQHLNGIMFKSDTLHVLLDAKRALNIGFDESFSEVKAAKVSEIKGLPEDVIFKTIFKIRKDVIKDIRESLANN